MAKIAYNKGTKIRKEAQGATGNNIMKKFNIDETTKATYSDDFGTIISKDSKKGEQLIENAKRVDGYELYNVYNKASYRKEKAWKYCKELCRKYNGTNLHIVGHNTCTFSVSFNIGDKVAYITNANNYLIA